MELTSDLLLYATPSHGDSETKWSLILAQEF